MDKARQVGATDASAKDRIVAKDRRKIEKKRKKEAFKRKVQLAYRAKAEAVHRKVSKYPEVLFDESEGDAEFVSLIKETQKDIDLDDPAVCNDSTRRLYQQIKDRGFDDYRYDIEEAKASGGPSAQHADFVNHIFMLHYGSILYGRIPEELRRRHLPFNDVYIGFAGNKQVFRFSSLLRTVSKEGTIYHSRKQPKVMLGGKALPVGFSRHAIEQAIVRLNPNYLQYQSSADVHAFFAHCVLHEPAVLDSRAHPCQPAFSMYDRCTDPTFAAYDVYVNGVFGLNGRTPNGAKGEFHYRVGYFPVVEDCGFAKAITFLRPGYSGTPEVRRLLSANLPREKKARLLRQSRENTGREALIEGKTEVIKWFHDNGIPQVVQFQQKVFDYGGGPRTKPLQQVSHESLVKTAMADVSRRSLKDQVRRKR